MSADEEANDRANGRHRATDATKRIRDEKRNEIKRAPAGVATQTRLLVSFSLFFFFFLNWTVKENPEKPKRYQLLLLFFFVKFSETPHLFGVFLADFFFFSADFCLRFSRVQFPIEGNSLFLFLLYLFIYFIPLSNRGRRRKAEADDDEEKEEEEEEKGEDKGEEEREEEVEEKGEKRRWGVGGWEEEVEKGGRGVAVDLDGVTCGPDHLTPPGPPHLAALSGALGAFQVLFDQFRLNFFFVAQILFFSPFLGLLRRFTSDMNRFFLCVYGGGGGVPGSST